MSVKIIVDSTVDLIPEIKEKVSVVPLTVRFGDEEYIDSVTINHQMFYQKLTETKELPSTSQASPAAFDAEFAKVSERGDTAVVITVSSQLSGTYQSALIAADDYKGIYVVDSKSVAIGSAILVEYAILLAERGLTAEGIAAELEKKKDDICLFAILDTLEYLKRGGRISPTIAFAGALLNIKPMAQIKDGKIDVMGKARGLKQGYTMLLDKIERSGGIDYDMPVLFGYTGLSSESLNNFIDQSGDALRAGINTTCIG
ncbi:MAG: DegV family protein, partial [Clostridia bacterium]|nr:DegV family protein [Clostridia bacterium]